ncbi:uncharacterized protein LOC119912936 [Micropterus salmoides]|uniref:uncharacterized protein LOC119912936 n=1 Tax=Micropterus salmoides TaxID=27706 RepID=UPI0018ECEA8C|nr:uncharacterized protein LOC119912936 [Micropterus salmoides]
MALLYPATIILLFLVFMHSPSQVDNGAQSKLICSDEPIVALAGGDVILPCRLEPAVSAAFWTVEWTKPGLDPKYIHVHQHGNLFKQQNPSYNYRTILFMDELMKGNVSLKIFSVKTSDAGTYKCFLPSIHKEASIELVVGESDVTGSHEPVKAVVGDDVILPCHLEPPFDVKTLTVEWKCNKSIVHVYRSMKDYLDNQDQKFKGRTSFFDDEMTRGNISLKLTNVTEQDAGNYSCFVPKLHSQVRKGYVTLIVDPESEDIAGDTGIGPGGIIGIVFAAIAGAAIVAVLLKKRQDQGGSNVGNTEDSEGNNPETLNLTNRPNTNDSEENNPDTAGLTNRPNTNDSEENNPDTAGLTNRPNTNDSDENNPDTAILTNRPNTNDGEENNPDTAGLTNRPNTNDSEENNPDTAILTNRPNTNDGEENNPDTAGLTNRPNTNDSEENNPETAILTNRPNTNDSEENNPETAILTNRPNTNDGENNPETAILTNRPNTNDGEENNPETAILTNRPNTNDGEENNPETAILTNRPNTNDGEENNPETAILTNRPNTNDGEENNPETAILTNRPNTNDGEENNPETAILTNRPDTNDSEENNPQTVGLKERFI